MAMTLRSLCKYAGEKYNMRQVSGDSNLSNLVSWVHRLENEDGARFLNGQELIFCTGIELKDADRLLSYARTLYRYQASGLVIKLGPYIPNIPQEFFAGLKEIPVPVFTIPLETKIVDITEDFCRKLVKSEENEITVATAFRNAMFSPERLLESRSVLERKEFNPEAEFCVIVLAIDTDSPEHFDDYDKHLRMHLTKILIRHTDRFNLFRHDNKLVAVLQNFPKPVIENSLNQLCAICNSPGGLYRVRAGASINEAGISALHRSYRRASTLLQRAERQGKDRIVFENADLFQLLLEVDDPSTLKRYYDQTLGKLNTYDEKHGTDYTATLKTYLDHNASVMETAEKLYVHRNTINYKIKRAKEIMQCELTYQNALKLLLAYYIEEIL